MDNSIRCRLGRSLANGRRHVREDRSGASRLSASFSGLANSVAALRWDIHGRAQGHPDVAHRNACRDRALRREIAQLPQGEIPDQGAAVDLAELVGDRTPKLAQPHCLTRTVSPALLYPVFLWLTRISLAPGRRTQTRSDPRERSRARVL